MELHKKIEVIQDCSSPYVALVLIWAHRRSVRDILQICLPEGERDIYCIATKPHSMCPSRDKIQLCTGPQQRECNQQVEGSGSAPVFSTEAKFGCFIHFWATQDTILRKGREPVRAKHMA